MPEQNAKEYHEMQSDTIAAHEFWDDPLIRKLEVFVRLSVRALAILMTLVIMFSVLDVMWVMYEYISTPPYLIIRMSEILQLFGAFIAVLIAIEIFVNITVYLRKDVIHVNIVLATALLAIARKVIILDFSETDATYVFAVAAVVFSMSIAYWLIVMRGGVQILRIPWPKTGTQVQDSEAPEPEASTSHILRSPDAGLDTRN